MRMKHFLLSCLGCSLLSGAGAAEAVNLMPLAELSSKGNPDKVALIADGSVKRDHTLPGSVWMGDVNGWGDEITVKWDKSYQISSLEAFGFTKVNSIPIFFIVTANRL